LKFLSEARKAMVSENLNWLQSHPTRFQQIASHHRHYTYPYIANLEPEAALYQIGFFNRSDEKLFKKFQSAALEEKEKIVDRLTSLDARTLAIRLLGRNYPKRISKNLAREFEDHLRRVNPMRPEEAMVDYKGEPRLTPSGALSEIKRLKKAARLNKNQIQLLDDLQNYIKSKFPRRMAGRQLSFGDRF
jgi:exodeoxyribonuclease-1